MKQVLIYLSSYLQKLKKKTLDSSFSFHIPNLKFCPRFNQMSVITKLKYCILNWQSEILHMEDVLSLLSLLIKYREVITQWYSSRFQGPQIRFSARGSCWRYALWGGFVEMQWISPLVFSGSVFQNSEFALCHRVLESLREKIILCSRLLWFLFFNSSIYASKVNNWEYETKTDYATIRYTCSTM